MKLLRYPKALRPATAVLLVAWLALVSSSGATPSPAKAAPLPQTIVIGIDAPLNGTDAPNGESLANGAVLAIEDANAHGLAGGAFRLRPDVRDDAVGGKHDPKTGAQNARAFIENRAVLATIGPLNSNVAAAQIPLTNEAGLVQISPAATSDSLTVGPEARELRGAHVGTNTFFRVCARDSRQGDALAHFARMLGWRSVYVIDDGETYGKGLADDFAALFAGLGGKVIKHDRILGDEHDFKALLAGVKAAKPDVVFFGGTTSTGAALLRRQMVDAGMSNTPYVGGDGFSGAEFVKRAGDAAINTYYSVAAADVMSLSGAAAFVERYRKRFATDPGAYSGNSYAATQVAIAAIEVAIKDEGGKMPSRLAVLRRVAETDNLKTLIGAIKFDNHGDTTAPTLTLKKIDRGKLATLDLLTLQL